MLLTNRAAVCKTQLSFRELNVDPIFSLIQQAGKVEWKEMYQDFNMGVGFEIVADPKYVDKIISIAESYKLEAQVIGFCEKSLGDNKLEIVTEYGKFDYN